MEAGKKQKHKDEWLTLKKTSWIEHIPSTNNEFSNKFEILCNTEDNIPDIVTVDSITERELNDTGTRFNADVNMPNTIVVLAVSIHDLFDEGNCNVLFEVITEDGEKRLSELLKTDNILNEIPMKIPEDRSLSEEKIEPLRDSVMTNKNIEDLVTLWRKTTQTDKSIEIDMCTKR